MLALKIPEVGDFMKKLLTGDAFDGFYLCEGEVRTFASFSIGGRLNREYYSADEQEELGDREYASWPEIKPFVYSLLKGSRLPVSFALTLQLSGPNTDWLLQHCQMEEMGRQLRGLYLNIRYQRGQLTCITGMSYQTFVMDKRLEQIWDDTARRYLRQKGIVFEEE